MKDRVRAEKNPRLERTALMGWGQEGRRLMAACQTEPGREPEWGLEPWRERMEFLALELRARLVAHPGGAKCHDVLGSILQKGAALRGVSLIVGPEGGLAPAELAAARANGWRIVDLGDRILRVETAALALAAAVMLYAPAKS